MIRVLFVCLGNICRSPMSEGIFNKLIQEKGIGEDFIVDSAGTSHYHTGELPDTRMRQKAAEYSIQLTHLARQFVKEDFDNFDYIVAMDKSNYNNILSLKGADASPKKVLMMREFDTVRDSEDVPDPYYGGPKGFEEVYQILLRSNRQFLQTLLDRHFAGKNGKHH